MNSVENDAASILAGAEEAKAAETFYRRYGKRIFDIVVALPLVIFTLPVNLVIAIVTFLDVGRPILFKQKRSGKDGKPITIVKFRNMRNTVDEDGFLLPARQRVTRFGRFIRATSLDELLQFWNVLFGTMSIIGPRPLGVAYMERYSPRHRMRLLVRPGLECPMHVDLEHERTWQDQLENDVWYVQHVSFRADVTMLLRLVRMVFDRRYAKNRAAALRGSFLGYKNGMVVSGFLSERDRLEKKITLLTQRYERMCVEEDDNSSKAPPFWVG